MNKKEIYQQALISYGFLTVLFLLEENKIKENFRECKIIFDVLREHSLKHNVYIPMELSDKAIEEYETAFWKFGLCGEIAVNNTSLYVEEVKKELKKYNYEN